MLDRGSLIDGSKPLKNRSFGERLAFAIAGILHVWRHERSFRAQSGVALLAAGILCILRPPAIWWAAFVVVSALVLALEAMNGAIEYVCDRLHPELCDAIKHAKDAAAGAVLLASTAALLVGGLFLMSLRNVRE